MGIYFQRFSKDYTPLLPMNHQQVEMGGGPDVEVVARARMRLRT